MTTGSPSDAPATAEISLPDPGPRSPGEEGPTRTHPWTMEEIDACTVSLLGKQGPFRPSVRLLESEGRMFAAKDYRACTPLYRWTVGVWNLRKERAALERLKGIPGVPLIEGDAGRWVLVLTWFKGKDLGRAGKPRQTPEFFDEMMNMVREMHRRGVVHLDLRQRRNVLVRPGRHPAIIDFGASLCLKPGGRLLRYLALMDTSGVLKYKQRARPGSLTEDEARILQRVERRRRWWPFG